MAIVISCTPWVQDVKSKDPSKNCNGGEYDFDHRDYVAKGKNADEVFRVFNPKKQEDGTWIFTKYWTSSEFDYCQACGNFQRTHRQAFPAVFCDEWPEGIMRADICEWCEP